MVDLSIDLLAYQRVYTHTFLHQSVHLRVTPGPVDP